MRRDAKWDTFGLPLLYQQPRKWPHVSGQYCFISSSNLGSWSLETVNFLNKQESVLWSHSFIITIKFHSFTCRFIVFLSILKLRTDMRFVKNFTPPDFQAKKITPLSSPYFNSFGGKKNTKKEWKLRNILRWQKNYTAAGSDGGDKSHLCNELT